MSVGENITLQNGGAIRSETFGQGDAGDISLTAEQLTVDRQGGLFTEISSGAFFSTGNAGNIELTVTDLVSLRNGGKISSISAGEGVAGSVVLSAGQLEIEGNDTLSLATGIDSSAGLGSTGDASGGSIEVSVAETISIQNGGSITSDTFAPGDGGNIVISAGQLLIDQQGSSVFTGVSSEATLGSTGNAGNVEVNVTGLTAVRNGGEINTDTLGLGDAGSVVINSRELLVDGEGNGDNLSLIHISEPTRPY